MKEKLPAQYHGALDTQVCYLPTSKDETDSEQSLLRYGDLHSAAKELMLLYNHSFGLVLPNLNHPLFLIRYIRDLALPRESKTEPEDSEVTDTKTSRYLQRRPFNSENPINQLFFPTSSRQAPHHLLPRSPAHGPRNRSRKALPPLRPPPPLLHLPNRPRHLPDRLGSLVLPPPKVHQT